MAFYIDDCYKEFHGLVINEGLLNFQNRIVKMLSKYIGNSVIPILTKKGYIRDILTNEIVKEVHEKDQIMIIESEVWDSIINDSNMISAYDLRLHIILLENDNWCMAQLLHETLHSISAFSQIPDISIKHEYIYEGLTELLTAYLINMEYPEKYNYYRDLLNNRCNNDYYIDYFKCWYYISSYMIDIDEIINMYFINNPENPFKTIVNIIKEKTGENIVLNDFYNFKQKISNILGNDFIHFMSSPLEKYDFRSFPFDF